MTQMNITVLGSDTVTDIAPYIEVPEEACHDKGGHKDASEDHHGYVVSVCSELIEIIKGNFGYG